MSQADVLVVDDDLDGLRVLVDLLEYHDFHVRAASSGRQALIAAGATRPDLMLLDVAMKDGDGFTVLESLRADPALYDVPVLMLSGSSNSPFKVTGLDLGAVDYIEKPYEPAELLARLRTHLRLAGARHAAAEVLGTTLPALLEQAGIIDGLDLERARLARDLAVGLGLRDPWRVELCVIMRDAGLAEDPGRLAGLPGLGEVGGLLAAVPKRDGDASDAHEPVALEVLRVIERVRDSGAVGTLDECMEGLDMSDFHPELVQALLRSLSMR